MCKSREMRISIIGLLLCIAVSCGQEKKYHDAKPDIKTITKSDKLADILLFQEELNAEFKNPETSPLADRFRIDFETLNFFAPDTNYIVEAKLI